MQFRNDEETKKFDVVDRSTSQVEQELILSDTWRNLLNMQTVEIQSISEAVEIVPAISNDPWNDLLHAQGFQAVDLQQLRLREMYATRSTFDVEQALHRMQEQAVGGGMRDKDSEI